MRFKVSFVVENILNVRLCGDYFFEDRFYGTNISKSDFVLKIFQSQIMMRK